MKRRLLLFLALLVLTLPMMLTARAGSWVRVGSRASDRKPIPLFKPGDVIVNFTPAAEQSRVERIIRDAGGLRARKSAFGNHYLVTLDRGQSVLGAVEALRKMRDVDYAEPNYMVRASFTPNDHFFSFQWNMQQVGAPRTWDIQKGKVDVVVAVVDTGIAYEDYGPYRKAPDWGNTAFVQGYDFVNGDTHPNDDESHGTHISSTIAEATNNGEGVAGLAFGCALMPVKVLDNEGNGSFFDVAEGIDYAVNFTDSGGKKPVKVINLSLGGPGPSETTRLAINRALAAGVVVVAASGNEGGAVSYPAAFPNVIGVGAVDLRKVRAPYSNFGPEISVVAPGGDLDRDDDNNLDPDGVLQQTFDSDSAQLGIYDDFAYFYFDGTSSATPHVSATAALLVSQGITDPVAVRKAIESTALDLGPPGRDNEYGHGLIQPALALTGLGLNQ